MHLANHVNPNCKVEYNPSKATNLFPDCNLMNAEQTTLAWLSRFIYSYLFAGDQLTRCEEKPFNDFNASDYFFKLI